MTFTAAVLAASLAVSASDRLAMADRLFNRGDFAAAKTEYLALAGEQGLDRASILYRLVASGKSLKENAFVRETGATFLKEFPGHAKENQVRFLRALVGTDEEKRVELAALDRDEVPKDIRAGALCMLGTVTGDVSLFDRSLKLDPNGSYSSMARSQRATTLMKSADPADRRRALALFMDLVFGKDKELAKDALYAASYLSYTEGKYAEADALAKRFLKTYPGDTRELAVRRMLAMSEYRLGKFVAALDYATDENDEWMLLVKASCNERLGRRAEARVAAEKAIERFPNGTCRKMIELILARLDFFDAEKAGDKQKILEAARRSVEFSKTAGDRVRYAWAMENAGEKEQAEEAYSAIARDFPNTETAADALFRRAMSLLRSEKWSPAEVALAEAIATEKLPANRVASAYYWRGICATRLDHGAEAVEFLKKALEGTLSLDESREARLVIADADYNAGRRDVAIATYAQLVREGAVARMSAAKTLAVGKLLQGDEARLCAKALAENAEAEWRQAGYALLGDVETAEGNLTAAAYAYQKCLDEPCQTEAVTRVSLVYGLHLVREGNAADGEKVLKRAVELNAKDSEARAAAYVGLARAALLRDDEETAKGYATVVVTLFENTKAAAEAKEILK